MVLSPHTLKRSIYPVESRIPVCRIITVEKSMLLSLNLTMLLQFKETMMMPLKITIILPLKMTEIDMTVL